MEGMFEVLSTAKNLKAVMHDVVAELMQALSVAYFPNTSPLS